MDKPTQSSGFSRYGRKRKLTDEYQAATSASRNAKSPEIELGRTRKATKAKADSSNSSMDVAEVPTVKNIIRKKGRRPARKSSKKRRGVPKKKAKIEDQQEHQEDEEPEEDVTDDKGNEEDVTEDKGNEEFISQQLLKISMDEQQPEQILIDLGNYRPVKKYGKIMYSKSTFEPASCLTKPSMNYTAAASSSSSFSKPRDEETAKTEEGK